MTDAEIEEGRLEVLRLLRTEVAELTRKLEHVRLELLGALNEKDTMHRALEKLSAESANWRVVEALALALSEKRKE